MIYCTNWKGKDCALKRIRHQISGGWVGEHTEAAKPSLGLGGLGLDGRGDALNFNLLEEHKEKKDL